MKIIGALILCLGTVIGISAQNKTPEFKTYPAGKIYRGKNAPLKISRAAEPEREPLQWALDHQKVDFAGHYIVAGWSCGMWCSLNPVIDAATGRVYWWGGILSVCFPELDRDFACTENFSNVRYRAASRLIIFFGYRNGQAGSRGFHYYKFENGRFIHLKSILVAEQRGQSELLFDRANRKTSENQKL